MSLNLFVFASNSVWQCLPVSVQRLIVEESLDATIPQRWPSPEQQREEAVDRLSDCQIQALYVFYCTLFGNCTSQFQQQIQPVQASTG